MFHLLYPWSIRTGESERIYLIILSCYLLYLLLLLISHNNKLTCVVLQCFPLSIITIDWCFHWIQDAHGCMHVVLFSVCIIADRGQFFGSYAQIPNSCRHFSKLSNKYSYTFFLWLELSYGCLNAVVVWTQFWTFWYSFNEKFQFPGPF
jgi:hypothetical protein